LGVADEKQENRGGRIGRLVSTSCPYFLVDFFLPKLVSMLLPMYCNMLFAPSA
jgi:hypothetical protein